MFLWYPPKEFFYDAWLCEKFAPSIPVTRPIGRIGFGDAVGYAEAAASDDNYAITSLGGCFMWNNVPACGGRLGLIFF